MPVAYFFDDDPSKQIQTELELLGAVCNMGVSNIALYAANHRQTSSGTVSDIIDKLVKREALERTDGRHG
ncbi:hypothetical protein JK2ML_0293 [Mycobacterium leprae Kyoto-2]|uniref:Uncharacterized protein n=3 Tax=Mycobacterium leprae TaxID=1769 RepID=Q9CCX1_MYCLE|nr:hypothetical protein [Mycobacterium leprae]CAR70386.1 hypothetical protein MLBr00293 [Mycobacterium leprae Br4923]AWV47254.1 hypothetical protein DIJ64_01560 [Mycobacterium leprae]OAR20063.1 hypothetical protein A8144_12455 [Mycobacterium leprae 3125609]OAX70408.1 hypothetical protein A3216_12115 [Mycobacterium leprae 7935681]CAC29801.1 hypothetical protein [Mycobacterium leprae]